MIAELQDEKNTAGPTGCVMPPPTRPDPPDRAITQPAREDRRDAAATTGPRRAIEICRPARVPGTPPGPEGSNAVLRWLRSAFNDLTPQPLARVVGSEESHDRDARAPRMQGCRIDGDGTAADPS